MGDELMPVRLRAGVVIGQVRIMRRAGRRNGEPLWVTKCLGCGVLREHQSGTLRWYARNGIDGACRSCAMRKAHAMGRDYWQRRRALRALWDETGSLYRDNWEEGETAALRDELGLTGGHLERLPMRTYCRAPEDVHDPARPSTWLNLEEAEALEAAE